MFAQLEARHLLAMNFVGTIDDAARARIDVGGAEDGIGDAALANA